MGVTLSNPALFRQACYVDGAWVTARSGATITVDNPATGDLIGVVPKLGAAETRQAIDAATRAFPAWRKKPGRERAAVPDDDDALVGLLTGDRVAVDALGLLAEPFEERCGVGRLTTTRLAKRFPLLARHQSSKVFLVGHHEIEPSAAKSIFAR